MKKQHLYTGLSVLATSAIIALTPVTTQAGTFRTYTTPSDCADTFKYISVYNNCGTFNSDDIDGILNQLKDRFCPTVPSAPECPDTPQEPETPETPTAPEVPTTPEAPSAPETPTTPKAPSTPETPTTPEAPSTPETPTTPVTPSEPETPSDSDVSGVHAYAKQVVSLVNEERTKAGVGKLDFDVKLTSAANVRSKEIVNTFSHTRPDGTQFYTAIKEQGFSYKGCGENIAWGQKTPDEVMNAWMNSSGHRSNILNSKYTKIGVGVYEAENGRLYWTQLFAY